MSEKLIMSIMTDPVEERCPKCHYLNGYCVCQVGECTHSPMSKREREMLEFGGLLCEHVGMYTVSQYGDMGEDNVTDWSARDCEVQIEKYAKRFKSNQRGFEEMQRDLKKICHYACLAYNKRLEEQAGKQKDK